MKQSIIEVKVRKKEKRLVSKKNNFSDPKNIKMTET